ncbi:hypothetical protein H4F44_24395, partial [Escherichia coli]|uniref:hypothetical protein n=1 Tax=Escherichia coli TaxID=562 RepID=UPI001981504F
VRKEDGQLYKSLEPAAAFQQVVSLIPILSVGTISAGDRYIYGNFFQYEGTNLVYMQVFYQGWIPITAIHVTEVGNNLHTVAEIVDGGIGQVYATIRVAAPGGNGFFIRIDMWGR